MPSHSGPRSTTKSNLIFAMDTHDTANGVTALGCGGFYGSTQGVKDLVSGNVLQFVNGIKLTGRTFYTAFAIDYPESSYGGDAAGCNGLYLGYNVRGGTGIYYTSRALHLWVWNNKTSSWIPDSYFHGYRLSGHCYDTYTGADAPGGYSAELGRFADDFNTIKSAFPDCTYIVMGSHRDSYRNSTVRNILYDLGMPTGTALDNDYVGAPEWILVGKPGLGAGNAYGWVYENYQTNPGYVAHLNFGLPIKGRGGLEFDGTNDYVSAGDITATDFGIGDFTVECIAKIDSSIPVNNSYYKGLVVKKGASGANAGFGIYFNTGYGKFLWSTADGSQGSEILTTNTWNSLKGNYAHIVMVRQNGASNNGHFYINGAYEGLSSGATLLNVNNNYDLTIGASSTLYSDYFFQGNIPVAKIYNKALTADEVRQNYNQHKTRFNLS